MVVTANRTPEAPENVPFTLVTLDGDTMNAAPAATLDDALRSVPGFSLFRRSDSFSANPTAQGVSLRGLGPSGASRSLILLDGVPLNDPFGGWVPWALVPRENLARAEVVAGGGATAWGDSALGGVVQLFTQVPTGDETRLAVTGGDFATRNAEIGVTRSVGRGTLQIQADDFATDGFGIVAPENRGLIDRPADSQHHWVSTSWRQPVGADAELIVTARTFAEDRGNGTPYQRNSSWQNFGSVVYQATPSKVFAWTATLYAQDQSYSSTFSTVNPTRTAETPANNQFAVPATALGAAWTGTWNEAGDAQTSAGVDWRTVSGETHEDYSYVNGAFTRERVAGGRETMLGAFLLHEQVLAPALRAILGVRLDQWRETSGHELDTTRATRAVLLDSQYPDRDGVQFSPSAGLVWQAVPAWRVHASVQQAFRQPTLNELYRPFRVGNVITNANPALKTEQVRGGEIGADYRHGAVTAAVAFFRNELYDAVDNVTLAQGPGTFPLFGTLPAGTTGQQRLNLDRVLVQGVQLTAKWELSPEFSVNAAALYDDTRVQRATVAPLLVGKQLAQVPRQSASLGASWRVAGRLTLTPRVRWLGRQFEDDQNQLSLDAALVVDLGVNYALSPHCDLYVTVENLTNKRIVTGRNTNGVINTGMPLFALGGVRCRW
jgi:outer membrane receptor protein involved in Fe transport